MTGKSDNPFRNLPAVTDVLNTPVLQSLASDQPRALIVDCIRQELSSVRDQLKNGLAHNQIPDAGVVADRVVQSLHLQIKPKLRQVINATGIILHTNLGRSPMAEEAAEAAREAAHCYLNLELDLETGKRSSRQAAIRDWVCNLTGAESATVVNNNAAATVIVLRTLAQGKEVVVSRGQLIEIGGSFRIPDIMSVSGAKLHEVGTTNITRLADYERAIGPETGVLMDIHTSNYRIRGFSKAVALEELVELGRKHELPVVHDVGSGAMLDFRRFGFEDEPVVRESIAAGANLVLFSGDKLLGGPQAGIIAGRAELIKRIEKDPLMRAFRLDKMTLAALEATLRLYLDESKALEQIPTLRMLSMTTGELRARVERLVADVRNIPEIRSVEIVPDKSYAGGGSLPDQEMQTIVMEVKPQSISDEELARRLRAGTPAVMSRVRDGKVVLDLRTVFPEQESLLVKAVHDAVAGSY